MGTPDAVKPMTWQRAAIRDERLAGSPAVAVVASLVTISPGSSRRGRAAGAELDFYASVPALMSLSRLGERSVRGALAELQRLGYLFQVKRGGWRNDRAEASTWRLVVPEPASSACSDPVDNSTDASGIATKEVPNLHETISEPAPDAGLRAEVIQERDHHPLSAYRTEGALQAADDDDSLKPRRRTFAELRKLVAESKARDAERARQLAALEARGIE